ncbi:MAG TPA: 50S ribosomal protein L23 [Candidatus Paceibacterota bacterium]|nr:50S ribosomal protein L23 [Candidatus Paceibacterota bacterium]HMP19197.1 50S ribosomal protein L23 [Candidatus Paceibacterota bacterium]HMP85272.1 50S ribosomal protein L23 [Candidatus Paceibacterota bacterium]
MALFSRKKKEEVKKEDSKKKVSSKKSASKDKKEVKISEPAQKESKIPLAFDVTKIIKNPRVSEKGAVVAEDANAYVFDVYKNANKNQIKLAIEKIYKVVPVKINITKIQSKKVRVRGTNKKTGIKSGGKKAFVYLKKGEKIEFI